jgi:hypothetical protein
MVAARVIPGYSPGLLHQFPGGYALSGGVVPHNENRLFKEPLIRGIHHDHPSGNTFNHLPFPPLVSLRGCWETPFPGPLVMFPFFRGQGNFIQPEDRISDFFCAALLGAAEDLDGTVIP